MSIDRVKPYFVEDVINILRSIVYARKPARDSEFMEAIKAVALSFGITEEELRKGT